MTDELRAVVAAAGRVGADERASFAARLAAARPRGGVVIETCHRVELVAAASSIDELDGPIPDGATQLAGADACRHVVRLAVGLESAVLGEDQILHQLRSAVAAARQRGALPVELDRLVDLALTAGRRARSWLPARRASLVEIAIDRAAQGELAARNVLVVGAGRMGQLAAAALQRASARVLVTSRTPEHARSLAERARVPAVEFDPGPAIAARLDGVVVAIAGRWPVSDATIDALAGQGTWLADVSAPPALPPATARRLSGRLVTIDELANRGPAELSAPLVGRLEKLVEATLEDYRYWAERSRQRDVAHALVAKAAAARSHELAALWRRSPALDPTTRAEVEQMATQLIERLLRDPLERLNEDADGRHAVAAREIFRL